MERVGPTSFASYFHSSNSILFRVRHHRRAQKLICWSRLSLSQPVKPDCWFQLLSLKEGSELIGRRRCRIHFSIIRDSFISIAGWLITDSFPHVREFPFQDIRTLSNLASRFPFQICHIPRHGTCGWFRFSLRRSTRTPRTMTVTLTSTRSLLNRTSSRRSSGPGSSRQRVRSPIVSCLQARYLCATQISNQPATTSPS